MPPKPAAAKGAAKPAAKPAGAKAAPVKRGSGSSLSGAKKGGAPAAGKGKAGASQQKNEPPKPPEKVWGPKDDAALKIQTAYRKRLAKKALGKAKKEKEEYDALMDRLQKEAFVHLVKLEQEEAERQRQKEDEERKRRAEEAKRRNRMLDAAFDGDVTLMQQILKEVSDMDDKNGLGHDVIGRALRNRHQLNIINCEDANANTPVSEAASGGHVEAIKFLLDRGAEPNCCGQFQRTPLYRAAFAGHMEACQLLLQNGADPRLYASDGQTPEQVASVEAVGQMLGEWDIAQTEILLRKLEQAQERRKEEERQRKEAEQSKLEDKIEEALKEYEAMQKKLDRAYAELNKRIFEHDSARDAGFERTDITLQTVHDAEADLEFAKLDMEKARDKLAKLRLQLRETQTGEAGEIGSDQPGHKVLVRELDDVLFRDVGNKIKDSNKWPLIIDTSGQAATFLRYRDTNYINAICPGDMEDDRARLAILGALRFGKPLVLDMMEVDMWQTVADRFDHIMKGLLASIMDRSILQNEKYMGLAKKEDGPEYDKNKFNDLRLSNFKFFIISKSPYPRQELLDQTYAIRVHLPHT